MSYIYTFIREDISPEQKIVQIGHACHEAGKRASTDRDISSLILLSSRDQEDLERIAMKLDSRGIKFYMFHEPDNNMGFSAICTEPIYDSAIRSFFRKWDLFRFR